MSVVVNFKNGYKVAEVFAKKTRTGFGLVFDSEQEFQKAFRKGQPVKGYAVRDSKGMLPKDCKRVHLSVSDAVKDYEEHVVPLLVAKEMDERALYGFDVIPKEFIAPERLFLYGVDEVNVMLSDGRYFHMHESMSEEGYDWTLFDSEFHIIDGGIYDDPEVSLEEVYGILAEEYEFEGLSVLHMEDEFEENMDSIKLPLEEQMTDAKDRIPEIEKRNGLSLEHMR